MKKIQTWPENVKWGKPEFKPDTIITKLGPAKDFPNAKFFNDGWAYKIEDISPKKASED